MSALHRQASEAISVNGAALASYVSARTEHKGTAATLEHVGSPLAQLSQALAADTAGLFADYVAWAKVRLAARGRPGADLAELLQSMREALPRALSADASRLAAGYIDLALANLPQMPSGVPSFIVPDAPLAELASRYLKALLAGKRQTASLMILDDVARGREVQDIYLQVFQPAQRELGRLWQLDRISVAQEHYCTAVTQHLMSQLYPHVFTGERTRGTLVATCVADELHELGTRMVCDFAEMAGWRTHYLGANTPTASVVQTLADLSAQMLAVSATIAFHIPAAHALIAAVRKSPACAGVRIVVGGHPFNVDPDLWHKLGADGCAADAREATRVINHLSARPTVA